MPNMKPLRDAARREIESGRFREDREQQLQQDYPQRTFEEWLRDTLEPDTIRDLAQYGAAGGFPGLTYYKDTGDLYDRYHGEIWEQLHEDTSNMGHENPLALIATFGGAAQVGSDAQFKNLLVWYMAEEVARRIEDTLEDTEGV